MTRGVSTRPAGLADLDRLVEICLAARAETVGNAHVVHPSAATLRRHLVAALEFEDVHLVVAEPDGLQYLDGTAVGPVGFALTRVVRPGLLSDVGWIQVEAIYVQAAHRRRGAGHALLSAVARLAAETDSAHVITAPLTGARSELRFLARLGFAAAGGHRIAETPALLRRLGAEPAPTDRRRRRGIEDLIAARRRTRAAGDGAGQASGVPLAG